MPVLLDNIKIILLEPTLGVSFLAYCGRWQHVQSPTGVGSYGKIII